MNPKNVLSLRWRTPRALALFGLMALIVVVAVLALAQTSTVAAPPPPLRGPFRFVELPDKASAAQASAAALPWTPFYTQTFDTALAGWTLTRSIALYPTPASLRWDRVLESSYPGQIFTYTLWSGAYSDDRVLNKVVSPDPTQYTQTMDTWAIYGPLDTQTYAHLRAEFDFYLDAGPGTYFGWGASNDGQTFCGKLGSAATGSRIQQWQHMTFDLTECSAGAGTPVYLAFFFQSSDTIPPAGLGAFVDNVVISGVPWNKTYLPIVSKEPTNTPAASPTPACTSGNCISFEPGTYGASYWCSSDNPDWAAGIAQLSGDDSNHSYYLKIKNSTQGWTWAVSPRSDLKTPNKTNFRVSADFNLLGMQSSLPLSNYPEAAFGMIVNVNAAPFNDADYCFYDGGAAGSGIGFFRFIIWVNSNGSGYLTQFRRWENGVEPDADRGSTVALPASAINRTGWNKLQIEHQGTTLRAYINGQLVNQYSNGWSEGYDQQWLGLFTEAGASNPSDHPFESNWDNITASTLP